MPPAKEAVTLAVIGEKIDHLRDHLEKIERRIESSDKAHSDLSRDLALTKAGIESPGGLRDQVQKQWRKLDWQYRVIWGLIVANAVQVVYLLGAKALGLIKIIP